MGISACHGEGSGPITVGRELVFLAGAGETALIPQNQLLPGMGEVYPSWAIAKTGS